MKAIDAVDLDVRKGDTVGIVGESGSGKSTLARLLARLIEPSGGEIEVDGRPVTRLRGAAAHQFRRKVQMVFQDPYRSLNPRRTVGAAISEGPLNFGATRANAWQRAAELMDLVKLSPGSLHRYPHEFSGGQRQRICIARALAVDPEILIADEAVSALDVSIQAQILSLLDDIQQRLNLTLVFITHDLRVAAQICNRVVVLQSRPRGRARAAGGRLPQPAARIHSRVAPGRPGTRLRFRRNDRQLRISGLCGGGVGPLSSLGARCGGSAYGATNWRPTTIPSHPATNPPTTVSDTFSIAAADASPSHSLIVS